MIGRHNGLMFYTLGQRQGLGIGGRQDSADTPWYVIDKRLDENRLLVGQGHNNPLLFKDALTAHDVNWIRGAPPSDTFACTAKTRYRQPDQQTTITVQADGHLHAKFDAPVRAITPGQSIVLYDGEVCLGGGVISELVD